VRVLVDSDVLVEVTRAKNVELLSQWIELAESTDEILYSPITSAELWAGVRPNEIKLLDELFSALRCVPLTDQIGRRAGGYLSRFRKSHSVELADALIAATVVESKSSLWTRNRKHYPMGELVFF
jgi:predicted nucleic acid-binding protein